MRDTSEDQTEPYGLYGKGGPERETMQMSELEIIYPDRSTF